MIEPEEYKRLTKTITDCLVTHKEIEEISVRAIRYDNEIRKELKVKENGKVFSLGTSHINDFEVIAKEE